MSRHLENGDQVECHKSEAAPFQAHQQRTEQDEWLQELPLAHQSQCAQEANMFKLLEGVFHLLDLC